MSKSSENDKKVSNFKKFGLSEKQTKYLNGGSFSNAKNPPKNPHHRG